MMSDKPKGESPVKQKLIMVAIIVILAIVIWQVIGMFSTGKPSKSVAPVAATPPPSAMSSPAAMTHPGGPMMVGAPTSQASPTEEKQQADEASVAQDKEFVENQKQIQKNYVDLINQLQTLRLQKEIAETSQAIASAKLATVTAERGMVDLLTRPTTTSSAAVGQILPPPQQSTAPTASSTTTTTQTSAPVPDKYTVISVSMKANKWKAVVGQGSKLYDVVIDDILPDGSRVAEISSQGIVLEKDGGQTRLSMLPGI